MDTSRIEHLLRTEWWLWHGCSRSTMHLYGDDGEMQCSLCRTDFKRISMDELHDRVRSGRMEWVARELRRNAACEDFKDVFETTQRTGLGAEQIMKQLREAWAENDEAAKG